MGKPLISTAVKCNICEKSISRKADLPRHMKTHAVDKEELMHFCPHRKDGCPYKTLQASNLKTHLNVHSRRRPNKCPEEGCAFASSDPGSLTRHRREQHGYEPKGSSPRSHASATHRTTARRRRRYSPYTESSSSGGSTSPLHGSPSPSLSRPNSHIEEDNKDISTAYSTELTTELAQVDESHLVANHCTEGALPLNSALLTALEACTPEHPQLPLPGQETVYATGAVIQPVCEMTVGDEVLNSFLSKFGDWQSAAPTFPTLTEWYGIGNVPITTPAALLPSTVDNARVPSFATLPSYGDQYIVDDSLIPTATSLPPYEMKYPFGFAPYEYYGRTTSMEAVSLDAQSLWSDSLPIPDLGIQPRAIYPQDIYQGCSYMGASGFAMQGLYPH